MNELVTSNRNNVIIPIPPRHIVEKYRWWIFEISESQRTVLTAGALGSMGALGITSMLSFPLNLCGYVITAGFAYLYKKHAWTHDKLVESETMLWYWWYKRQGLMNISYTDTYEKIKTLFPYEVRNIKNGIVYFGDGVYGVFISLTPRKLSPEEHVEYTPVVERLIDSLPSELIIKCRAKTKIIGENILEKLVFEQLQRVKTKQEKALLFSLYDKSKAHEDNCKWEHTLFVGLRSNDEEVDTYLQTTLPGITTMLERSRVLCTHIIDPIKILGHYSSDFSMYDENNDGQSVMLRRGMIANHNPLSQFIRGGASFQRRQIFFNHEDYASLILVGIPKDLSGGYPDDLKSTVLPQIYALSDSKEHVIEINVTLESIDSGCAIDEIKAVLAMIEVNRLSNKSNSNLRILAHSEQKYGIILEKLQDGTIHLNEVSYIITVRAKTPEKLMAGVSRVQAVLKGHSIKSQVAEGNVKDIFKATRFLPIRYPKLSTYMPTNAVAKVIPLITGAENIASSNPGKYCVYMGDDIDTGQELCFNLGEMGAINAVGFGATQGGKTTFISVIGVRMVLSGIDVIYTTTKQDGNTTPKKVAEHFKEQGGVIYFGRPPLDMNDPNYNLYKNINPLQILFDPTMIFDPKQTFFHQITILKQFINQICMIGVAGSALNSLQLSYVERSLLHLYSKFEISPTDPKTWVKEEQPTLIDLYNIWHTDAAINTLRDAVQAAVLEARTTSFTHNWDFLSRKTSFTLNKRFTVIDMSTLPADLIPAMNYFMTAVMTLRFSTNIKRKTVIMVDEGGSFIRGGLGASIVNMVSQSASQGVAIWLFTQQHKDVKEISSELLNNSFIRVVMGNGTEVPEVAEALHLPKSDQDFLNSCNKPGQFLLQMKSPFNKSYHCQLSLSELESELVIGKKQVTSATSLTFLSHALQAFSKERGFILADWIPKNTATQELTKGMIKEFIQRTVGAGKVWTYIPTGLIRADGLIQNQSPDHYMSVAGIAGWLIERGIDVVVSDRDGADIVATFQNGKKLAIEYQTSLPGNNRPDDIIDKWKNNENKYDFLFFVSDTDGVKELKSILKSDELIVPRGTQLETKLNTMIEQNRKDK
jgi:hypothetical protein